MVPVKIQCGCGQRYAFDVEPINGLMPSPVACPVCGVDGTAAANQIIAQVLAAQPAPVPVARPVLVAASAVRAVPPRMPPPAAPPPGPRAVSPQLAARGKDGWATEETQLNKIGTYVTVTPAILGAMLPWGFIPIEIPILPLCVVIGIAGVVGGLLNISGRGPLWAGAIIGLLIALGGYGAVCWWIHDRETIYKGETLIAFGIGAAPGMLLQYLLQRILRKRSLPA